LAIKAGPDWAGLLVFAHLGFLFITFFGELVFVLWLRIRGWKIQEPALHS